MPREGWKPWLCTREASTLVTCCISTLATAFKIIFEVGKVGQSRKLNKEGISGLKVGAGRRRQWREGKVEEICRKGTL